MNSLFRVAFLFKRYTAIPNARHNMLARSENSTKKFMLACPEHSTFCLFE